MAESANIAKAESHLSSNWFLMSEIQINLLSHQLRHLSLNVLLNCFLLPLDSAVGFEEEKIVVVGHLWWVRLWRLKLTAWTAE